MLRLAAWRMCEAGIVPIMLIHDGILLEETDPEQIEHAKEIMLQAGRDVCDGFEIGVDVDQLLKGGARYYDKRPMAKQMWATIMHALKAVRRNSKGEHGLCPTFSYVISHGRRIAVEGARHRYAAPSVSGRGGRRSNTGCCRCGGRRGRRRRPGRLGLLVCAYLM